jgi:ribosome-associated protein
MSYSTSLAALCARTLDDLKGEQISVLDLRGVDSSPADYFVVCSANSDTHARALTDALTRATVNVGERRPRSEGRNTGEWVLLDYFDVVIHVFRTDAREYYKLEKLWGDAPTLDVKRIETAAVTEEKAEADVEEIQTDKVPKKRASKSSSTMKTSRKATLDSDTLDSDKDTPLPAKKRVLKAQTTAKATAKATAKTKTKTKTAVKKAISASTDDAPKPARGTKTATKKTVETITETTVKTAPKPATKKATAIRAQKTAMKTRATKASEK